MSWLGDAVKSVVNVVADVSRDTVRIGIAPVASSVNSVFNKSVIDQSKGPLAYQTGAGKLVGGTVTVGTDSVHKALKRFANGLSGGYVSKGLDLIRSKDAKSDVTTYEDRQTFEGGGALGLFETVSKKGAGLLGQAYAGKVSSGSGTKSKGEVQAIFKKPNSLQEEGQLLSQAASANAVAAIVKDTTPVIKTGVAGLTKAKDMSLFSSLGNAAVSVTKAAQTPLGTSITSALGSAISGLLTSKPSPQAQANAAAAAFTTPTPANISENVLSAAAAAAFGNTGQAKFQQQGFTYGNTQITTGTWWDNNKYWATPLSVVLGIVVGLITLGKLLFSKRRR